MWFKNLSVFRLTKAFDLTAEQLDEKLQQQSFKAVSAQEPKSFGWVPPLGKESTLLQHQSARYIMLCAKKQEKILPASVINETLAEKLTELEEQEARKLSRKEKQSLKDEITFDLLPKAFAKSSLLYAYIALEEGLIVVNTASAKAAEDLLSLLRESLGSLAVIPLTAKNLPQQTMTQWLIADEVPEPFHLGGECELKALQEGGSIKCKEQDLLSEEIVTHVKSGMQVMQLALDWQQKLQFIVDDSLTIKRLKFSELIVEQSNDRQAESMAEQFDIDFSLMTHEIKPMLADLVAALGGEVESDKYQQERLDAARTIE